MVVYTIYLDKVNIYSFDIAYDYIRYTYWDIYTNGSRITARHRVNTKVAYNISHLQIFTHVEKI